MKSPQEEFECLAQERENAEAAQCRIDGLVEGREYDEWLQLECKEGTVWQGKATKEFKGILAKEVSAFANGAGGLIIWGYRVKRNHGERQIVERSPSPVKDVTSLVHELNLLTPECTQPTVDDVRSLPIVTDSASDEGYAVTIVAKSEGTPHRANMGGGDVKDKYFRRRCDQSSVMSHGELEDMFGRRPRPLLYPRLVIRGIGGPKTRLQFIWDIWNRGTGMGVNVVLEVRMRSIWPTRDVPLIEGLRGLGLDITKLGSDVNVHRSSQEGCSLLEAWMPVGGRPIRSEDGKVSLVAMGLGWKPGLAQKIEEHMGHGGGKLRLKWVIGAQDMRSQRGGFVLSLNSTKAVQIQGLIEKGEPLTVEGKPGEDVPVEFY